MKRKNIFIIVVNICFIFLLGTIPVYAMEYYGDFQYEDNGDTVSIYAYNGSDKEVTIPTSINEKMVTEISDYAFLLCNCVEKIIVPSTVTKIDANAFSGATNLKKVVLASSDTKIDDSTGKTEIDGGESISPTEKKSQYTVIVETDEKEKEPDKNYNEQSSSKQETTTAKSNSKKETTTTKSNSKQETTLQSNSKQETTMQSNNKQETTMQSNNKQETMQNNATEIAGIAEGAEVTENTTTINENNAVLKENQEFPVERIMGIVVVVVIIVLGIVVVIRKKKTNGK